jgi:hypothetical protein
MPPRKQPPPQDTKEDDDVLVTSKQFKEMMHIIETFNKTTTSMNEIFHKSQASTKTTLELVQYGIAAMVDRVQALETRLPNAATDPNVAADPNAIAAAATAATTYVDDDPFAEDTGVDNDEHFNLPGPPPRPCRPFNRQGMRGNQNHHNQQYVRNDDHFAKVKFSIPPFNGVYDVEAYLDWEMTVEQKFSSHLVPKQHRVSQATSEFKDFALI